MPMQIRSKVWLEKDGRLCFGAGRARILRAVERTGSLNGAAADLNMSYRHAWSSIRTAEERLGRALLLRRRGGKRGGGAVLTAYAKRLLNRFEALDARIEEEADRGFKKAFRRGGS
jgi:molybdate transport system regulatory protein